MFSRKHKVIFLMPAKTASQSLKECLMDSSIVFEQIKSRPKIHLTLSELSKEFGITRTELDEYKIVQVVRDPYDRFVSAYFHQQRLVPKSSEGIAIRGMDIHTFSSHFQRCIFKVNFLNCFYGNTDFIKHNITTGRNWSGARALMAQADWNDVGADVAYFRLEDLKDGMEAISEHIGVYLPDLPRKNESGVEKTSDLYSSEVMSVVEYVYDIDFQIGGYKRRSS